MPVHTCTCGARALSTAETVINFFLLSESLCPTMCQGGRSDKMRLFLCYRLGCWAGWLAEKKLVTCEPEEEVL